MSGRLAGCPFCVMIIDETFSSRGVREPNAQLQDRQDIHVLSCGVGKPRLLRYLHRCRGRLRRELSRTVLHLTFLDNRKGCPYNWGAICLLIHQQACPERSRRNWRATQFITSWEDKASHWLYLWAGLLVTAYYS